jgi:formyl-CoA transferase
VHDPQFIARDAIHWEQHDSLGRIPMPNVMPKLSATPGSIRRPAPDTVGQHTDEVLTEVLGLDSAGITALRDAAVI